MARISITVSAFAPPVRRVAVAALLVALGLTASTLPSRATAPAPAPGRSGVPVPVASLAQADGAARLRAATLELDVRSPTQAGITATYELDAAGDVELLVSRFPGQRIEAIEVEIGGTAADLELDPGGDPRRAGVRRATLPYPGGAAQLRLRYQVRLPEGFAFRYPVILPEATPPAGRRSVRLRVLLPPGTWPAGGGFPNLRSSGSERGRRVLETSLVAVPSFVHVPHGTEPPGPLDRNLQLELVAILAILLPLTWFGWRHWRRRSH